MTRTALFRRGTPAGTARGRGRRAAHDQWAGTFRDLLRHGVLDLRDLEALCLDRSQRRAVAVTADHEPVDGVHAILLASEARIVGPDVLDEEESATRSQHPAQFTKGSRLVIDTAEHQGRDGGVERVVLEGEILGRCTQDEKASRVLTCFALEAAQHRDFRLRHCQCLDGWAVKGQVTPGTCTDLEHPATRLGEHGLPMARNPAFSTLAICRS